ncbi:MAG: CHASE2 domain-containing protein [Gammaproteobacteria bacterium]
MNKRIPIFLGFILLALAVWLQITTIDFLQHFINRLEDLAYDVQLRTKLLTHPTPFQTSVAIVDIDDKSIAKEGRWPWPRSKLAELGGRLQGAGAVVIVYDMFFAAKEINVAEEVMQALDQNKLMTPQIEPILKKIAPLFDNDMIFANSLKQTDTVIGMSFLPNPEISGVLPPPVLTLTPEQNDLDFIIAKGYIGDIPVLQAAVKSTGFVNVFGDVDGIIRSVPLLIRYKNDLYPSLALQAVSLYLLSKVKLVTGSYGEGGIRIEGVKLADHIIPTDEESQVIVPFRGRSFTFPYFSATDVLNNKFPADAFQGKLVFVGTSATGLGDLKATAIESAFPGVEIQATIADGILSDNFSFRPPWGLGAEVCLTIVLGSLFAWFFPYLGPRLLSVMIIIVPALLMIGNNELWVKTGLIISIFIPIILTMSLALLNMIYGYLFETRRREHLKEMFGQYVPAKHIDEMLTTSGGSYGLYGEDREMTVLFADVRNFTTISEKLSATQLKELLNDFFTPMTEIIFKHRGTIDKYVGDLIMAFWGAPLKDKRHAQHAISAAIEMQNKLKELRPQIAANEGPDIHIGIGLNSGVMSVGDMGSKFRRNYTVLGDAVNLASRVESLTKHYGVDIMVTEFTEANQKNFVFRQLDRVRVKGKEKGIAIYEVVCRKQEATPEINSEITESDLALNYYFNSDWEKAQALFAELHSKYPHVKLYKLYLERIEEFKLNPPPENWDGIYVMKTK